MIDSFVFWLFLLMICTLVLLVETAGLIRGLLTTRRVRWSSFFIMLPLVVSVWSLVVSFDIANRIVAFSHIGDIHFTIELYRQLLMAAHQIISDSQLQIGLIVAVFILTLLLEKFFCKSLLSEKFLVNLCYQKSFLINLCSYHLYHLLELVKLG